MGHPLYEFWAVTWAYQFHYFVVIGYFNRLAAVPNILIYLDNNF